MLNDFVRIHKVNKLIGYGLTIITIYFIYIYICIKISTPPIQLIFYSPY